MKQQRRILVIDREPRWRSFIRTTLQSHGFLVQLGSDDQTVLREIADDNFDLIIIDARLLNWLDAPAVRHLRHRLLVVTAAPAVPEAIWAYRRGALDYASKTFDEASLLATVDGVLGKQPVPHELLL